MKLADDGDGPLVRVALDTLQNALRENVVAAARNECGGSRSPLRDLTHCCQERLLISDFHSVHERPIECQAVLKIVLKISLIGDPALVQPNGRSVRILGYVGIAFVGK